VKVLKLKKSNLNTKILIFKTYKANGTNWRIASKIFQMHNLTFQKQDELGPGGIPKHIFEVQPATSVKSHYALVNV
jgi:hypothetical protein